MELCFPFHDHPGFAVVADGSGGQDASQIAVASVVETLNPRLVEMEAQPETVAALLKHAAIAANDRIAMHVRENPPLTGLGTTLAVSLVVGNKLHWMSIGDSVLFVFDGKELRQVNEDHSLAPHIDLMAAVGQIAPGTALSHPDRYCLTSLLMGTEIPRIDCGKPPIALGPGDVVVTGSDGLLFISEEEIAQIILARQDSGSESVVEALMDAIERLDAPDQDNISIAAIRVF